MPHLPDDVVSAATLLRDQCATLRFGGPVTHVYNPLNYAWQPHLKYLQQYAQSKKRAVFLGMNPGPFGMAQTGVPFGEIAAVRDWLRIDAPVEKPLFENPKRPILGFDCPNSEVSGRRLWGLFQQRFTTPTAFFVDHFVANYCPLVFMNAGGKNITPDKLTKEEREAVATLCDKHLQALIAALAPEWLIGVGAFAEAQGKKLLDHFPQLKVVRILHPSPASPAANKGWSEKVTATLESLGIW